MAERILITGCNGTIGSRLSESIISAKITDINPRCWIKNDNHEIFIGDLCDSNFISTLPMNIDMVVHLAANARVYDLVVDPKRARDNLLMLFNILEYCRINGIRKLLFSSSREIYGNSGLPVNAEDDVHIENCESPYTASKIAGEALIHAYHKCYGIDYLIMRFSNVYGMYDISDRIIPLFIKKTFNNENLTIFGLQKYLDFTYIDDTVNGILQAITHFDTAKNSVYNIASGKSIMLVSLAEKIISLMNRNNKIIIGDNRIGEVVKSSLNISKAETVLDYHPKIEIDEGLQKSVEWYTNYYKSI